MVLYSISNTYSDESGGFDREVVIDEFISAIWTERFIEAGEVEIVLPAAHRNLKLLAPGNLLGCSGSQEIMLLETRSIENGLVKATGKTIESFFNERYIPGSNVLGEITAVGTGADILKGIVNYMQDWLIGKQNAWGPQIASSKFRIRGLFVDAPNPDEGEVYIETIPSGPVYDTLVTLAKKYRLGQSVIWTKMEGEGHRLVYTTRQGIDRTWPAGMLFSPKLDNIANVKQLLSVVGSKNIVTVVPPEWILQVGLSDPTGEFAARVGGGNPFSWKMSNYTTDRQRIGEDYIFGPRYIELDCTDLTLEKLGGPTDLELSKENYFPALDRLFSIIQHRQKKILVEDKPIKMIDGEITPVSQFVYKRDYDLGDFVKVQGNFGDPLWAVISEYVRSHDETGERSYPTVSVNAEYIANQGTPDTNPPINPTIT